MDERLAITWDSTCDLTEELYTRYRIQPVPLGIVLGEELKRDGVDVGVQDVFDYVKSSGTLPKTSAVSVGEYHEIFKAHTDKGRAVIHINISAEFSSCYQNAVAAAGLLNEEDPSARVYVVDSRNLSSGSGHLCILARELSDSGASPEEVFNALEKAKEDLDVSFVLQTLEYLQKGGRCPGILAFGANLLKLRPEIEVSGGRMVTAKKYRGSMEKSILDYVRGRLEGRQDLDLKRIMITHSYVPGDIVEKVRALVLELAPFEEVYETFAGCTVSSHCGPCCLGVLFFKKSQN